MRIRQSASASVRARSASDDSESERACNERATECTIRQRERGSERGSERGGLRGRKDEGMEGGSNRVSETERDKVCTPHLLLDYILSAVMRTLHRHAEGVLQAAAAPGTSCNTRNALSLTLSHRARFAASFTHLLPDVIARLQQPCIYECK
eukprot:6197514-Pleurochrysis_carterae.AAC.3